MTNERNIMQKRSKGIIDAEFHTSLKSMVCGGCGKRDYFQGKINPTEDQLKIFKNKMKEFKNDF